MFRARRGGWLESPPIQPPAPFDDLVLSLSADVSPGGAVELAACVRLESGWTRWHPLGVLSRDGFASSPRSEDAAAAVDVDRLRLKLPASAARFRLKFRAGRRATRLRAAAVALSDGRAPRAPSPFVPGPWTRELRLVPRSQMEEREDRRGRVCAPTALAMVLEYWGIRRPTERVALAARDRTSGLFGNWTANAAYAAAQGLEARAARLESLREVEAEIAAGRPVVASVAFEKGGLPGAPLPRTAGHLLVVIGFTAAGDVIVLDPAAPNRAGARRVYPRAAFHKAWRARKRGLAYLIGPSLPRKLYVGVPCADLWSKPVRRAQVRLDDSAHLSQLLYGEAVAALEAKNGWVRVRAEEQASLPAAGTWQGYPGWLRAEELVSTPPVAPNVVVRVRQALVQREGGLLVLSAGTRLARFRQSRGSSFVRLLDGSIGELPSDSLYEPPAAPTAASRAEVIRAAELFLGASYYWGGRSGVQPDPRIGVDCSGLASLAYRVHGRDIPRDSHEQRLRARALRREDLKEGDLVFLTERPETPRATHVMIYTGGDGLIESRKSSGRVLRATFRERFGRPLPEIESGDVVTDYSFPRPRRRRVFFGSYF